MGHNPLRRISQPCPQPKHVHLLIDIPGRQLHQSLRVGKRRLGQLCADPGLFAFDLVIAQARYALRRAGLVVGGDLWTAVAATGEEEGFVPPDSMSSLAEACQRSPAVLDLVRLALSPEYAEVRWNLR